MNPETVIVGLLLLVMAIDAAVQHYKLSRAAQDGWHCVKCRAQVSDKGEYFCPTCLAIEFPLTAAALRQRA